MQLVADLIADFEEGSEVNPRPLPLPTRLRGLLEAHGLRTADLGRLLGLDPGMGSKILKGTRRLTADHIRILSGKFGLPGDYFLAE